MSSFDSFLGLVSLSTGNVIFPNILGPVSLSAWIFSINGGSTISGPFDFTSAAVCKPGCSLTGCSVSFSGFFFSEAAPFLYFSAGVVSFFVDFFGRVEESIKSRSILSSTFGDSISGAFIFETADSFVSSFATGSFVSSFAGTSTGTTSATGAATGTSSLAAALGFSSFFFIDRSSSSLFFLGSLAPTPLGRSICSAFCFAALSCWNSDCSTRYISSESFVVGFRSSLLKLLDIRKSIKVLVPMLNSLAAAINLGVFTSDIRCYCCPDFIGQNLLLCFLITNPIKLFFFKFFFQNSSNVFNCFFFKVCSAFQFFCCKIKYRTGCITTDSFQFINYP